MIKDHPLLTSVAQAICALAKFFLPERVLSTIMRHRDFFFATAYNG
jgi:hypothetical protein